MKTISDRQALLAKNEADRLKGTSVSRLSEIFDKNRKEAVEAKELMSAGEETAKTDYDRAVSVLLACEYYLRASKDPQAEQKVAVDKALFNMLFDIENNDIDELSKKFDDPTAKWEALPQKEEEPRAEQRLQTAAETEREELLALYGRLRGENEARTLSDKLLHPLRSHRADKRMAETESKLQALGTGKEKLEEYYFGLSRKEAESPLSDDREALSIGDEIFASEVNANVSFPVQEPNVDSPEKEEELSAPHKES